MTAHPISRAGQLHETRAASQGAFAGNDIASDEGQIAGCSANNLSEPGKAGVRGSIPRLSTTLYLVFCGLYDPPYTPERYAGDMTWDGTVKDIADRQFPSLRQVIEIGTGRDVTAQMRAEAGLPVTDAPLTGQDKIDWVNDRRADRRKHERV